MIPHTKAFATYKALSQAHLDFVVVVCSAVPILRSELADLTTPLSASADHFRQDADSKKRLQKNAKNYQAELARSTHITVFSYFESYIKAMLAEMVEFHGGGEHFKTLAHNRSARFVKTFPAAIEKSKRKLQRPPKGILKEKYQEHSRLLDKAGYRFPTELLAHYGVINLLSKAKEKNGMRAWEIPTILSEGLLLDLTDAEMKLLQDGRSLRNEIAHGKAPTRKLTESLMFSSKLHTLAVKIDKHIVEHFFVLQRFV